MTAADGLGLLIDLARKFDRYETDIIYFQLEHVSDHVGVIWERVLPGWFRSLSAMVGQAA